MSARTLAAFKLADIEQTIQDVMELLDAAFEATGDGSVMAARIILSNGRSGITKEYFPPAYMEDCKQFDICPGCEGTGRDPRGLQHVCNRCGGSGTFSTYRLPGLAPVHPTLRACLERILAHHGVASQFLQGAEECLELGAVLMHWRRGKVTRAQVVSEVADVLNMAEQIALVVGEEAVQRARALKIERELARIHQSALDVQGNETAGRTP